MVRSNVFVGLVAAALGTSLFAAAAPAAQAVDEHAAEQARVIEFWTPDKVAKAVPRDFVLEAGTFRPAGKPTGGGSGGGGTKTTSVLAASWTGGGAVTGTTGKVLFSLGTSYYVCSASVVTDSMNDRSLILTAGHCVYDETAGQWAGNWMFIPDYDAAPAALTTNGSFCASTKYGCWVAKNLVASRGFTEAGGFNDQATLHDYAFAVVGNGGKDNAQLDAKVGGQAYQFAPESSSPTIDLFGYPAGGKFKGNDLVYSSGPLGTDSLNSNKTYRVGSSMTSGSSGGPWFKGFAGGTGTIMSVTSYGYSGTQALFGPMLNAETAQMYDKAMTVVSGNVAY